MISPTLRLLWCCIVGLALAAKLSVASTPAPSLTEILGTYRPYSANVGGAGRSLRGLGTAIVLNADHTYTYGSEHGTYRVKGDQIRFSAMKLHPVGKLSGRFLSFEYEYQGLKQTLTYLRYGDTAPAAKGSP